jgi:PAS domain S-box-containing protein
MKRNDGTAKQDKSQNDEQRPARDLFDTLPIPAYNIGMDGTILSCNKAAICMLGYTSKAEVVGKPVDFLYAPSSLKRIRNLFAQWKAKGTLANKEVQIRTKNGDLRTVLLSVDTVYDDAGVSTHSISTHIDVTEQLEARGAIRDSDERFLRLAKKSPDIIYRYRLLPDPGFDYINPAIETITGYSPDEFYQDPMLGVKLVHEDDRHFLVDLLAGQVPADRPSILRWIHKDGHLIWTEDRNTPVTNEAGQLVAIEGITRDITEMKRAESELKEVSEWSEAILHHMAEGVVEQDAEGSFSFVNPATEAMLGYSHGELRGQHWTSLVPPDQQSIAAEANLRRARGETDRYELELLRKDGTRLHAIVSGTPRWIDGAVAGAIVVFVDVTEQEKAAAELALSERRYRAVSELTSDFSYAFKVEEDGSLTVEWVTSALERLSGFTAEELHERGGWSALLHPDDVSIAEAQLQELLAGQESTVEYRVLTKDGAVLWMRDFARAVWDETQERAIRIEGAVQDITKQRESQDQLHSMLEGVIRAVSMTSEVRDPYTAGHQQRVAQLAVEIARVCNLPPDKLEDIRLAGLLHDIGKICVPAEVLAKPTTLSEAEFGLIRRHPEVSRDILGSIPFANGIAKTAYQHHERLDGSGYPEGLGAEEIGIEARIIAVSDVVEAMSSHRPYRASLGTEAALMEIKQNREILYDSQVVDACVSLFEDSGFVFQEQPEA